MRNGNGLYVMNIINVYVQFYLPVFVFLQHRSSWNEFSPDSYYIFLIELNNTAQRGISLSTENTEHCTTAQGTRFDVDSSVSGRSSFSLQGRQWFT